MVFRLEYAITGKDVSESLNCRIADPLWTIARQWQVGEFDGEDAGSAVIVRTRTDRLPVTDAGAAGKPRPYDGSSIEAAIESEGIRTNEERTARSIEAGLHLLRLFSLNGLDAVRTGLRERFPPARAERQPSWNRADEELHLAAGRGIDGDLLYRWLEDGGNRETLTRGLQLTEGQLRTFSRVLESWMDTYRPVFDAASAPNGMSWSAEALRYDAEIETRSGGAVARLTAMGHVGGRLAWHSFDIEQAPTAPAPKPHTTTVLATPGTFRGMPKPRWWEFEDNEVAFGDIEGGADEVAASLVTAFATIHSDDWMVVPVKVPTDTFVSLRSVEIQDSFGEWHPVPALAESDRSPRVWRFFEHSLPEGEPGSYREQPWLLFLSGTTAIEGSDLEQVDLLRDEGANLGWAIERVVQGAYGNPMERSQRPVPAETADEWTYRLRTELPDGWIPLIPEDGGTWFRRGRLARWTSPADGARGKILEPWRALRVHAAAIPNGGVRVTRCHQRVRTPDGGTRTWVGRNVKYGIPTPRIEFAFDQLNGPHRSDAGTVLPANASAKVEPKK